MSESYSGPMRPWPALEPYGRTIALAASGCDVFLYDTGPAAGETVLMVHGLGDEADSWRELLPELAVDHRVLAVDLPGFGRSSYPSRSLSPPFLVSALLELLDALQVSSVLLVGSSLGGVLCQQITLAHPERAGGLVLLDGTLVATGQSLNPRLLLFMMPGLGEWLYTSLRRNPQAAYDTLQPYYANLDAMPQASRDFLFQRVNERVWSNRQRRAYFSVLRQLALWTPRRQRGVGEQLGRCQVPTLVLWGEQDQIITVAAAQALLALQPTARLVIIPGAGHLPHQERPQQVLEAMKQDGRLRLATTGSNDRQNVAKGDI